MPKIKPVKACKQCAGVGVGFQVKDGATDIVNCHVCGGTGEIRVIDPKRKEASKHG